MKEGFDFKCRSCGASRGSLILDLGIQPLANNLLRPQDLSKTEPKFPLRLALCHSCWLLQIVDLVPAVDLFSEYLYFSSFSDLMLRHAKEAASRYIREFALNASSLAWASRMRAALSSSPIRRAARLAIRPTSASSTIKLSRTSKRDIART